MTLKTETYKNSKARIASPYPITYRFKPGAEFSGCLLAHMMHTRFPFRSEKDWEQKVVSGKVGVNDQEVDVGYALKENDEVFHHNPNMVEPSVPDEVSILQEEEEYLIVYKPAPMPMHPGGRYFKNTLTTILEEMGYDDLRIVHRLDAVTSGIVLFAKNKAFAKEAMNQFKFGNVEKTYYALVNGIPQEDNVTINESIRRKKGFVFESGKELEDAKSAETRFEVVKRLEEKSIIACYPKTGRTHQIRLHLKAWGYPIIDDPIYGPDGDESSSISQNIGVSLVNAGLASQHLKVSISIGIPEWK